MDRWFLDTLAANPLGLTPSALIHTWFVEFRKPLNVPIPEWVEDDDAATTEGDTDVAGDAEYFVHAHRTPVRDPLKIMLNHLDGVVYDHTTNAYVLGDRQELLRVHMKKAVRKLASGAAITHNHWNMLFRTLDIDGSGKLNRNEVAPIRVDDFQPRCGKSDMTGSRANLSPFISFMISCGWRITWASLELTIPTVICGRCSTPSMMTRVGKFQSTSW